MIRALLVCSMALTVRDEPDSTGGRRRRVFVSAYVGNYVWRSGGWRMTTVSSTFSPHPPARCPSSTD
jgi:hypothetical protein